MPKSKKTVDNLPVGRLPDRMYALWMALENKGEVPIATLYTVLTGEPPLEDNRKMQMGVGSVIVKLNKKLAESDGPGRELIVRPGIARRTYSIQKRD